MSIVNVSPSKTELEKVRGEMSEEETAFLSLLLRHCKPCKILEVGVAAGGTSAVILGETSPGQVLYGVDLSERWYHDRTKRTGWKVEQYCDDAQKARYNLLLGKDVIYRMEEVGRGVDFCILDTVHALPGEMLQFFAILPYLAPDAMLVLHDLSLNFTHCSGPNSPYTKAAFATRLLFTVLASKRKMLPDASAPNIGAMVVDKTTRNHIENAFFALGVTWHYFPEDLVDAYRQFIKQNYSRFCQNMFEQSLHFQKALVNSRL